MRQLPAVGHHFHAVGADLLGIGRQYRYAVIRSAEQVAGSLVVGHGVATAAEFGDCRFFGHLAGIDFFLQGGGRVEAHIDDRPGLVEARVQHLALHQIAGQRASKTETEQRHTHQDAELGGNLQVAELHGNLRGMDKVRNWRNELHHGIVKSFSAWLPPLLRRSTGRKRPPRAAGRTANQDAGKSGGGDDLSQS